VPGFKKIEAGRLSASLEGSNNSLYRLASYDWTNSWATAVALQCLQG